MSSYTDLVMRFMFVLCLKGILMENVVFSSFLSKVYVRKFVCLLKFLSRDKNRKFMILLKVFVYDPSFPLKILG